MKRYMAVKMLVVGTALLFTMLLPAQSVAYVSGVEELCLQFVEQKLQSEGGVFTNYLPLKENTDWAAGHSVLSESQGLMLSYYTQTKNKAMAQNVIAFVQDHLDTGSILSYRLEEDGRVYKVNAAVDDLRLIRAMLEGQDAFQLPDIHDQAILYAKRLYDTNVRNQVLVDFFDDQYKQAGGYATLCYSDFYTMNIISAYDKRWLQVMENMRELVMDGYLGDAFPFFDTRYNLEKQCYESENVPMVESLLTAYHLSKADSCPIQTVEYIKKALQRGKLYSIYDLSGTPLTDRESTAIYALCALIGASEYDAELYSAAIERMLPFQVMDEKSPVYGAFADAQTLQAYSFDNLMALLALDAGKVFSQAVSFSSSRERCRCENASFDNGNDCFAGAAVLCSGCRAARSAGIPAGKRASVHYECFNRLRV